jgi:hypothetical protein
MSEGVLCHEHRQSARAMRNCARDEEGPFGFGNQVLISSQRKLPSPKAATDREPHILEDPRCTAQP